MQKRMRYLSSHRPRLGLLQRLRVRVPADHAEYAALFPWEKKDFRDQGLHRQTLRTRRSVGIRRHRDLSPTSATRRPALPIRCRPSPVVTICVRLTNCGDWRALTPRASRAPVGSDEWVANPELNERLATRSRIASWRRKQEEAAPERAESRTAQGTVSDNKTTPLGQKDEATTRANCAFVRSPTDDLTEPQNRGEA